MTGVTIARAPCWITRGCRHAPQVASALSARATPMAPRPRYSPIVRVSSVPSTMWFMFRTSPVRATMATWAMRKATKAQMMRKWSDRPICRLPGSPGYQGKRFVKAGDRW